MRCIRTILHDWAGSNDLELQVTEYDVRLRNELPDTSYDIYISSGGPGDPLISRFDDWDIAWGRWLDKMTRWNQNPSTTRKKYIFFICHSFQLACRYFNAGWFAKKSTAFVSGWARPMPKPLPTTLRYCVRNNAIMLGHCAGLRTTQQRATMCWRMVTCVKTMYLTKNCRCGCPHPRTGRNPGGAGVGRV